MIPFFHYHIYFVHPSGRLGTPTPGHSRRNLSISLRQDKVFHKFRKQIISLASCMYINSVSDQIHDTWYYISDCEMILRSLGNIPLRSMMNAAMKTWHFSCREFAKIFVIPSTGIALINRNGWSDKVYMAKDAVIWLLIHQAH